MAASTNGSQNQSYLNERSGKRSRAGAWAGRFGTVFSPERQKESAGDG
jgi:hypothetical protein